MSYPTFTAAFGLPRWVSEGCLLRCLVDMTAQSRKTIRVAIVVVADAGGTRERSRRRKQQGFLRCRKSVCLEP